MEITFISVFTGIGGFDLGFERAGMRCVAQVEIDDYARRVLAKHWPDVPKFVDVRDCGAHNLPHADVIVGGFPCQDISNAGKRAGIAGERSGLWAEFARLIRELRPRYVVVENVPALLVRGMGTVLGDLAACGYDAEWSVLSACALGAPHTRERLFILGYAACQRGGGRRVTSDGRACGEGPSSRIRRENIRSATGPSALPGHGWAVEPTMGRVAYGVPFRMDRLRGLGNAVVPQVGEVAGRIIVAHAVRAARQEVL